MDIAVGDTILTRKKHPCGAASFEVLRVGMDFRIRCTGCGREVMLPRAKIEKNIKKVIKPGTVSRLAAVSTFGNCCKENCPICQNCFPKWRRSATGLRSFPSA